MKQTFDLNVRFSANYVRFGPKSGRIDTVTVESARDPFAEVDDAAGEVGQDRRQDGAARSVRHVLIGRGGGAEGLVLTNLAPDRRVTTTAKSSMSWDQR